MKSYLNKQFKIPTGKIGALVGFAMSNIYKDRIIWTVDILEVQPDDHVLEIGFGPGVAIQQVSSLAENGFVAGVDPSRVMVRQAKRRNRKAIRTGQVDIQRGSVREIPFDNECFDKAFTINSYHHWPLPQADNLKEIKRVLKPGGQIFIAEQTHWVADKSEAETIAEGYKEELSNAGFINIDLKSKLIVEPGPCFILLGEKS